MKPIHLFFAATVACGSEVAPPHAQVLASITIGACAGSDSATKLQNEGGSTLTWEASTDVPNLSVDRTGSVPPGGSVDIHVRSTTQDPGPALDGTVTVHTNDPANAEIRVPVRVLRDGPRFILDRTSIDFGILPVSVVSPSQSIAIKNTGTTKGTVTLDPADGFSVATPLPVIEPGASTTIKLAFQPTKTMLYLATPTVSADGYCGQPPIVTLKGLGSDGVVGISPGMIDMGLLACGTKPSSTQKVTVINASKQPFHASFLFASTMSPTGTIFAGTPDDFMVPGESQQEIVIDASQGVPKMAPIINGYWNDKLTVTTDAPKDTPHDIPVAGTPAGGVVLSSTSSWDFGRRKVTDISTHDYDIDNYGNLPVTLALTTKDPFSVASTLVVTPGQTSKMTVTHTARGEDVGAISDETIDWSTTDPICAPLPALAHAKVYTYEKATMAAPRISQHSCAAGASGPAYCWGSPNIYGELGTLKVANNRPSLVATLTNVKAVGVGVRFSCALEGNVPWCWGDNYGSTPVKVSGISDGVALATGSDSACVLRSTGAVACWGRGYEGQLGDGNGVASSTPVAVSNLSDAVAIDAESWLTCAVRAGGTVVCWGRDAWSNFGGIGMTIAKTPVTIAGVTGAKRVAVNYGACAMDGSGGVVCWGTVFGSNGPVDSMSPVTVNISGAISIAAGSQPSAFCAIVPNNGQNGPRCWGYGGNGELGTGTNYSIGVPLNVSLWAESVTMGWMLAMAIQKDGSLWQWGTPEQSIVKPTVVLGFDP